MGLLSALRRGGGWIEKPLFHGTRTSAARLEPREGVFNPFARALHATDNPNAAGGFATRGQAFAEGANIRPVQFRGPLMDEREWAALVRETGSEEAAMRVAQARGYRGVQALGDGPEEYAIWNADDHRSLLDASG